MQQFSVEPFGECSVKHCRAVSRLQFSLWKTAHLSIAKRHCSAFLRCFRPTSRVLLVLCSTYTHGELPLSTSHALVGLRLQPRVFVKAPRFIHSHSFTRTIHTPRASLLRFQDPEIEVKMSAMFSQNPLMNGPNYSFNQAPSTASGGNKQHGFYP